MMTEWKEQGKMQQIVWINSIGKFLCKVSGRIEGRSTSSKKKGYTDKRVSCCGSSNQVMYNSCVDKSRIRTKRALKEGKNMYMRLEGWWW